MRTKQRYKNFSKNFSPLICVPQQKILKFHRSKWKKIQKKILKEKLNKNVSKLKFKNYSKLFCFNKRWDRVSAVFKNQLFLKKSIQVLFFNSVSNKYLKNLYLKNKSKNFYSILQSVLYKTKYRIDILLFQLGFFQSPFLAKHGVQNNQIKVNNCKLRFLTYLVKGDIIFIPKTKMLHFRNKLKESVFFFSFIEVDYYTNQIVIVKDLKELNEKDFFLLSRELYNTLDLRDHLFN